MTKKDKIVEYINNVNKYDLVALWNDYCDNNNCFDDELHSMEDIDELVGKLYPTELDSKFDFDSFSFGDNWFYINGYGYFESTNDVSSVVDMDSLANAICNEELNEYIDDTELFDILEDANEDEF